jgi:hypothetical protein
LLGRNIHECVRNKRKLVCKTLMETERTMKEMKMRKTREEKRETTENVY